MGSWTLDGNSDEVVTILDGMREKVGANAVYNTEDTADFQIARYTNPNYPDTVAVCLGENKALSGENNCLAHIELPDWQLDILKRAKKAGKKVVAVICAGRPLALEEAEPYCDAILYTWHTGTMAGAAVADVLYGDVAPNGKLPMTFPRCTGQVPIYYNKPSSGRYADGYYNEGRNFQDCLPTPMVSVWLRIKLYRV